MFVTPPGCWQVGGSDEQRLLVLLGHMCPKVSVPHRHCGDTGCHCVTTSDPLWHYWFFSTVREKHMFLHAFSPSCCHQPGGCKNWIRQLPSQIVCPELYFLFFNLIIWAHTQQHFSSKSCSGESVEVFDLRRDEVEKRFRCLRGWSVKKKKIWMVPLLLSLLFLFNKD